MPKVCAFLNPNSNPKARDVRELGWGFDARPLACVRVRVGLELGWGYPSHTKHHQPLPIGRLGCRPPTHGVCLLKPPIGRASPPCWEVGDTTFLRGFILTIWEPPTPHPHWPKPLHHPPLPNWEARLPTTHPWCVLAQTTQWEGKPPTLGGG